MKCSGFRCAALAAILLCIAAQPVAAAPFTYRTIALKGQPAPQLGDATIYSWDNASLGIAPNGQVIFGATLGRLDGTTDYSTAVWLVGASGPQLIARVGDPAPEILGATIKKIGNTAINSAGQVLQEATLTGPDVTSSTNYAVWLGAPGNLQLTLRSGIPTPAGDTFPSPGGVLAGGGGSPSLLDDGTMILANAWSGAWSGPVGALAPRVRIGDLWARDAGFKVTQAITAGIAADGRAGYVVTYYKPGTPPFGFAQSVTALLEGSGAALDTFCAPGDPAPGLPSPAQFGSFTYTMMASSGDWLITTSLGGVSTNRSSLWTGPHDHLTLVARQGDLAPGTGGLTFGDFSSGTISAVISRTGEVVFTQRPGAGPTKGIWAASSDGLHLLAYEGDRASDGSTITAPTSTNQPAVNPAGQVAFAIDKFSSSGDPGGVVLYDPASGLHVVARQGQFLEVAPGDFRQISGVQFRGGSGDYGNLSGLSDAGEVIFRAYFTDGSSGIFVATIPEPASASLLAVIGLVVWRRRR